jgi:hypothetical protein
MACITVANMRRGVLLHKLILLEVMMVLSSSQSQTDDIQLVLAMSHGTFCFMSFEGYGWYLSSTAALLYCSYFTHNVVAWMKIKPFFVGAQAAFRPAICKWVRIVYLTSLAATAPVMVFEIANNFRFFNNISRLYEKSRPYEPLYRDPWWVFSILTLFHIVRKCYSLNVLKLVRKSPRFGILLAAIFFAISFTVVDIISSIVPGLSVTDGINPYWKLALVFKCLTDNIMLDDFKSVLQRLGAVKLDGTNAMQSNSLNLSANEKLNIGGDEDETRHSEHGVYHKGATPRHMRMSLSGRILDDGETLDGDGRSRRRQSLARSGIGRFGVKMSKLPSLSFIKSKAERQAERNMKLNKQISHSTEEDSHEPIQDAAPWDSLDFVTALTDPEMQDASRVKR